MALGEAQTDQQQSCLGFLSPHGILCLGKMAQTQSPTYKLELEILGLSAKPQSPSIRGQQASAYRGGGGWVNAHLKKTIAG